MRLQKMMHAYAMHLFGSDKPDCRIPQEFIGIIDLMKSVKFIWRKLKYTLTTQLQPRILIQQK